MKTPKESKRINREPSPFLPCILSIILITGMVWAADFFHEPEIIFPEIAAIATGALYAPKFSWRTSYARMWIFIMVCALLGVGIVSLGGLPLAGQMCLSFILAQLIFTHSGTTFAPMISAIVLPVMLQASSPVYLGSAAIMTGLILCVRKCMEGFRLLEPHEYTPVPRPGKARYGQMVLISVTGCGLIVIALFLGIKFAVAPPLLVAYTELWNPQSAGRSHPFRLVGLISLCALTGAAARYFIVLTLGLPVAIAVVVTVCLVFLFMKGLSLYAPPAAALAILAFLIPAEAVPAYPLQIFAGITAMTIISQGKQLETKNHPLSPI